MERTALDLSVTPQTLAKPREGVFANNLKLYISILLLVALASYGYWLETRFIFACQASGYSATRYLAYCNGRNYADYEHAAFAFDLEPPSLENAANADVLFLGNSKIQIALSNQPTEDWFSAAKARYYLMGFSYSENMVFNEFLLRKMHPRASVFVINVDDFFSREETPTAQSVLHDSGAESRYEWKRFSQIIHWRVCGRFPALCGKRYVVFRSRETGAYYRIPQAEPVKPENAAIYDRSVDEARVKESTANAIDFLKQFAQGKCVILTDVPYPHGRTIEAEAIAKGVGLPLVTPENLEGLYTSDGLHLDQVSADRWARGFFAAAGPEIRACLEGHGAAG
jgi:hypothetical protein